MHAPFAGPSTTVGSATHASTLHALTYDTQPADARLPRRFFLTTPIYYVNDVPHLGTTYTSVAADILARFHRLRGEEVLFATGTDENATKVVQAAERAGVAPLAFVDGMADRFRQAWSALNVQPDVFIRTTEPRHREAVQRFFTTLQERGEIYQGPYEGWYCVSCETYFTADEAPDVDGIRRCPNEPLHAPLKLVRETNYFFALSRYGERLLEWIRKNPGCLQPEFRKNEVVAFIEQGLRDVCVTRSATGWGIPVPGDESQVIYVWFDALINYITLLGYPDREGNLDRFWPADLHLVGKDIYVRFHCTLWPAMLMAAGLEPPRCVFGHGFWMVEGRKMSKTLGNFVEPLKLAGWLQHWSGARREIAIDAVRYFLFREMPFGEDGNFSRQSLLQRYNGDLANDLGNALNRSLSMTVQNFGPVVPAWAAGEESRLAARAKVVLHEVESALEALDLQGALVAAGGYVSEINKFLDEKAPWALAREGRREELGDVLYQALEALRVVSVCLTPFVPAASAELRSQLGLAPCVDGEWGDAARWGQLPAGAGLRAPSPIFPRIERKTMTEALNSEQAPAVPTPDQTAVENVIGIEDFARVELRVAEILTAERVPKADKLLHLTISLGDEQRTILAGIAEYYAPEDLPGRRVIVVANLAPRKMRGLVSQGMLLAAEADGRVCLLQPDQELPAGAKVR